MGLFQFWDFNQHWGQFKPWHEAALTLVGLCFDFPPPCPSIQRTRDSWHFVIVLSLQACVFECSRARSAITLSATLDLWHYRLCHGTNHLVGGTEWVERGWLHGECLQLWRHYVLSERQEMVFDKERKRNKNLAVNRSDFCMLGDKTVSKTWTLRYSFTRLWRLLDYSLLFFSNPRDNMTDSSANILFW